MDVQNIEERVEPLGGVGLEARGWEEEVGGASWGQG